MYTISFIFDDFETQTTGLLAFNAQRSNRDITIRIGRLRRRQQIVARLHRLAAVLQERHTVADQRRQVAPERQMRHDLDAARTHQEIVDRHADGHVAEGGGEEHDQQDGAGAERLVVGQRAHARVRRVEDEILGGGRS